MHLLVGAYSNLAPPRGHLQRGWDAHNNSTDNKHRHGYAVRNRHVAQGRHGAEMCSPTWHLVILWVLCTIPIEPSKTVKPPQYLSSQESL